MRGALPLMLLMAGALGNWVRELVEERKRKDAGDGRQPLPPSFLRFGGLLRFRRGFPE